MPGSIAAEVLFISAMMVLILIICAAAVYFFFKTYKKEMREKRERAEKKISGVSDDIVIDSGISNASSENP